MPPPHPLNPTLFATTQLSLLASEQSAETSSTSTLLASTSPTVLARAGLAVLNLVVTAQRTGMGGNMVWELERDGGLGEVGVGGSGVRVGDVVWVGEQPARGEKRRDRDRDRGNSGGKGGMEGRGVEGVVVRVNSRGLGVAVREGRGEEEGEGGGGGGGRLWVVKLANEVTYKRMNQTMERLKKMEEKDYTTLTRILFGLDSPTPIQQGSEDDVKFFDEALNESQRDAVRFALASKEVALIHGPPGTGKTYTLIELILQLIHRKQRILVCGPSNISVDNIVERLSPHKLPILRLGHPARLLPSVLNHSLDVLTQTSEAAEIVKDVRKEMDVKQASIKKTRNGRERRAIYTDMKDLRKEYREREKQCVGTLVGGSKVVLATLHGAGGFQLRNEEFDVVIIDEASQALEAQCWIPLLSAKKVVLAGDHLQLPPTIKSTPHNPKPKPDKDKDKDKDNDTTPSSDPSSTTLETTLFSRLLTLHGPTLKRLLTTQYRMHASIMSFPSAAMYDSLLIAAPAVSSRLLTTLPYPVVDTDDTREPLIFYDTQGGDFPESAPPDESSGADGNGKTPTKGSLLNDSKSNPSEALLVKRHVRSLMEAGVKAEDIAVITPYNAQLSYLANELGFKEAFEGVELGSVDGFQGREKEVVVLCLVRSNEGGEVGFLRESRRLNVAMTRARRQLCVVGDGETVGKGSGFLKRWMEHLEEYADLRYPDVADLQGV